MSEEKRFTSGEIQCHFRESWERMSNHIEKKYSKLQEEIHM